MTKTVSSRLPGFYRETLEDRHGRMAEVRQMSEDALSHLVTGGGLDPKVADRMSENVVSTHGLPLSLGLNFRINQRDVLIPMAVEEPSVVAACSNAARLVRIRGGFVGEASEPIMTTQVQFDGVPNTDAVSALLSAKRMELIEEANQAIPRMVARGGGCVDLDARVLDKSEGIVVVHLYVHVGDAMGANIVDTVAEHMAPVLEELIGGAVGLRILSNLPVNRMVNVRAEVGDDVLGAALCDGIVRASRFADLDPYRAVTHNKGIMNGLDAAAVALGQDWRSIEAGAHGWAALGPNGYRPLARWTRTPDGILGELSMPLAVGTVGGSTRVHRGVQAAFELVNVSGAKELAVVLAAAGLASNLAALKALAGEGIQKGHMRLHERRHERAPNKPKKVASSGTLEGNDGIN